MSDENKESFVETVSETVSTDIVTDLKVGIYNLFVSLVNNLIIYYGPEEAVKMATDYLDEITLNFRATIKKQ